MSNTSNLAQLVSEVAQALTQADLYFGHGADNAHDEAAWLTLHALGLELDTDLDTFTQAITADQRQRVHHLAAQRIRTRKPLAYLTHSAYLQGVEFYIDERAIVPRSLIAELICSGELDYWVNKPGSTVLDLCTGNASLACLAALAWPHCCVMASDISAQALEIGRINVQRHELQNSITLIQGDGLQSCRGPWDLILCNPPYVTDQSMDALPAEYLAEPALALAGGSDGMDIIRTFIQQLSSAQSSKTPYLSSDGAIVLEIGQGIEHFVSAFPLLPIEPLKTSAGDDCVISISARALELLNP